MSPPLETEMNKAISQQETSNALTLFNAETARNLLKALAAPRNNHIELFQKPVQVGLRDIEDLTERVAQKLGQLKVDPQCVLMKTLISMDKDRNYQVIGWKQLKNFSWKIPERTKSLILAWEFMYQTEEGDSPQLHVLSVRITEAPNYMQYLRAALSRDREELERYEVKMAPVVCEVEYVDGLLSRELVHLVGTWHQALRRPAPLSGVGQLIQENQAAICELLRISLDVLIPLAVISMTYLLLKEKTAQPLSTSFASFCLIAAMLFTILVKLSGKFAESIARLMSLNIDRMGRFPIFELTNGDQNNQTAALSRITASTYKFWGGITVAFIVNVASAVFTFYVIGLR